MPDHGPIYTETLHALSQQVRPLIVEPWNAASAIPFILIALYWGFRLRHTWRSEVFLSFAVVMVLIGGVGGTLYHALRTKHIYLLMDWMPIAILAAGLVMWVVERLTSKKLAAFTIPILGFVLVLLAFRFFAELGFPLLGPSVGYLMLALYIILPLLIFLKKTDFIGGAYVFGAIISFAAAYISRSIDHLKLFQMGTHFLWHLFGALATHWLISFVWKVRQIEKKKDTQILSEAI